jgi:signal transduction histidine kinase
MKLVSKVNKYYLILFLLLFPFMVALDFYLIKYIVHKEVDNILQHESEKITFHLKEKGELPTSQYIYNIAPANADTKAIAAAKDTLIYEDFSKKLVPYRTYGFTTEVESKPVQISLRHILIEMNHLTVWLCVSTSIMLFFLIIGLFFINQRIFYWTWKPFFRNLSALTNYDIIQKQTVVLESSNIEEFDELNKIVTALMDQVRQDFQNLKEFNENISHEIQTPLAIIRNKMILLLESQNLNEKELKWVNAVYQETNKLSKIGKSLTLISRIENQEFTRLEDVEISAIIQNILSSMDEMMEFKNLKISVNLQPVTIQCDQTLMNILFTNLIKNAVQHNVEDGVIEITLSEERFEIVNTGPIVPDDTSKFFQRFEKGNKKADTLGLGLAISKKISDIYGFHINYSYEEEKHRISLQFEA